MSFACLETGHITLDAQGAQKTGVPRDNGVCEGDGGRVDGLEVGEDRGCAAGPDRDGRDGGGEDEEGEHPVFFIDWVGFERKGLVYVLWCMYKEKEEGHETNKAGSLAFLNTFFFSSFGSFAFDYNGHYIFNKKPAPLLSPHRDQITSSTDRTAHGFRGRVCAVRPSKYLRTRYTQAKVAGRQGGEMCIVSWRSMA